MRRLGIIFVIMLFIMTSFSCVTRLDPYIEVGFVEDEAVQTEYILGDEQLNLNGLRLCIKSASSLEYIQVTSDMISGNYDLSRPGKYTVYVNYKDFSLPMEITVLEPEVENITIEFPDGYSLEWFEGDDPDFGALTLSVEYANGFKASYPVTQSMFTKLDLTRLGEQQVVLVYGGKTASFTVNIKELNIVGSEILTEDFNSELLLYGEVDLTGLKIKINFYDERIPEKERSIIYDVTESMVEGIDTMTEGEKEFTVYFRGCVHKVSYTVFDLPATAPESDFVFELDDWGGYSIAMKPSAVLLEGDIILPRRHNDLFVTSIKERGFVDCRATKIELFRTVKAIGNEAFADNERLTQINLENISFVGKNAFESCSRLTRVDLTSVRTLSASSFENCVALSTINIGTELETIEERAFYNVSTLESLIFESNIISVGKNAFAHCAQLKTVKFAELNTLSDNAFSHCEKLTSITLPNSLKELGNGVFSYCTELKEISIPDYVQSFGEGVFDNCSALTAVELPYIQSLPSLTFNACSSLTRIVLPDTIKSIESYAFRNCSSLSELVFGNIGSIGDAVFAGCVSLQELIIPDECVLGNGVFLGWKDTQTIRLNLTRDQAESKFDPHWDLGCDAIIIYKT